MEGLEGLGGFPVGTDYHRILEDLQAQLREIDARREKISTTMDMIHELARAEPNPMRYQGLKIADAVREHLGTVGEPQTTQQICIGLREGGLKTKAKHFSQTVYNSIDRQPDIIRKDGTWRLLGWEE